MFRLIITSKFNPDWIARIESETLGTRPYGLAELFAELASLGHCESCEVGRIYYIAYLLSTYYSEAEFKIEKDEPKIQQSEDWSYEDILRREG